jgi:hypothetical protein
MRKSESRRRPALHTSNARGTGSARRRHAFSAPIATNGSTSPSARVASDQYMPGGCRQ